MADNDGSVQGSPWPLPKFRFVVNWDDQWQNISFEEVSGMEAETQTIEYRASNPSVFSNSKMSDVTKHGNVTLKRGVFKDKSIFWDWYNQMNTQPLKRQTVTVALMDEEGKMTMTWTLLEAWATKVSFLDRKSEGNEVAIDSIEIAHEGLTVANHPS